jgi:hypothetical protein
VTEAVGEWRRSAEVTRHGARYWQFTVAATGLSVSLSRNSTFGYLITMYGFGRFLAGDLRRCEWLRRQSAKQQGEQRAGQLAEQPGKLLAKQ